jgi:putative ABC transport system permease protein
MTAHRPRPSRVILWLLSRMSSHDAAEAVVGDLLEALDERREAGRAPRWPRLWLNGHAVWWTAVGLASRLPRIGRSFGHAFRDAARALRRAPAHALLMLVISAAGIAAATITFSVVDAVMLEPLPFDHSDELVAIGGRDPRRNTGLSAEEFWAVHDHVAGLDGVGTAFKEWDDAVTVDGTTDRLPVERATAECLRVLRLHPLIGRFWTAEDEAHDERLAVISYELWQHRFGGDPQALGRSLGIENRTYRVIGVLPAGAGSLGYDPPVAAWVPRVPSRAETRGPRVSRFVYTLGRIRPGVSLPSLTTEIEGALAPLAAASPSAYTDWRPDVERLLDTYVDRARGWLLLVSAAVTLVVLIACLNAASVMLIRSTSRAHDLAIRASLGASRRQLAASVLAENLMVSVTAGVCALLFCTWGIGAVKAALPAQLALFRAATIGLNARVLAAGMAAAVVSGVLSGLVPAWQASRASVVSLLKDAVTLTPVRRRWRSIFLTAEVASLGALLVVATLFIASFVRVMTLDLGFNRSDLLAVSTVTDYQGTVDDLTARLTRIQGITGVAAVTGGMPPLVGDAYGGAWMDSPLQPVGADASAPSVDVETYKVTANYFDVAGMTFRRGATWPFPGAMPRPMIIDEVAARQLFGDGDPLGRQVRAHDLNDEVFTIVGTVSHAFARGPDDSQRPSAYYAMPVNARPTWVGFLLRTSVPPASLVRLVEASLAAVASANNSAGAGVHVVDAAFGSLTAARRFNAMLMGSFAIFALLIGGAGIYGVVASVVAQQTREIGLRVALGATPSDIRHSVLALASRHLALGLVVGLPVAWWISRGFTSLFFQVGPADPSVYLVVSATLGLVGLGAAIVPARRAARVDPIESLRAS